MSAEPQAPKKPSVGRIVLSTLAAAFGVQSKRNQERDFNGGNIYHYIAAGVIFTVVFILAMVAVVKWVLISSGV